MSVTVLLSAILCPRQWWATTADIFSYSSPPVLPIIAFNLSLAVQTLILITKSSQWSSPEPCCLQHLDYHHLESHFHTKSHGSSITSFQYNLCHLVDRSGRKQPRSLSNLFFSCAVSHERTRPNINWHTANTLFHQHSTVYHPVLLFFYLCICKYTLKAAKFLLIHSFMPITTVSFFVPVTIIILLLL